MIRLNKYDQLTIKSGSLNVLPFNEKPFSEVSISFLNDLSKSLRLSEEVIIYPDLMSFSFWCRQGNIKKLKSKYEDIDGRIGRGIAFHIAPSNVPLNFGYSFIFGILSGNGNIIKIPSKLFPQTEFLNSKIKELFKLKEYKTLKRSNAFIKYDKEDHITKYLSSLCDIRIVWGGDKTINNIRQFQIPVRSIDIAFSDRYSICIIDAKKLSKLDKSAFSKVIELFYNDTFFMDQNACSSPHIVFWIGEKDNYKIKNYFWEALAKYVNDKYSLDYNIANEKYNRLCKLAIELNNQIKYRNYNNNIYRISLNNLPKNIDKYKGNSGYFFEYNISTLNDISHIINTKYQTITYFGISKSLLLDFVKSNKLSGVDRIVPIGQALDIGLLWDGYDIIKTLSRIISFN